MKTRTIPRVIICASLLWACIGCCCQESGPQTFTTSDGLAQITVTNGMGESFLMENPEATLQVGNIFREIYALVISESKAEIPGLTLDQYVELLQEQNRTNIGSATLSPVEETTINGHPARKYVVTGRLDDLDLYFIFGVIEAGGHFNQLMTWTLADRKDKYKQVLDDIIESFQLAQ